jgi:hypothetical protein
VARTELNNIKQKRCGFPGHLNCNMNTGSLDRIVTGDKILCDIRNFSRELRRILPYKHDKYCVVFETMLQFCLYLSVRLSACVYMVTL